MNAPLAAVVLAHRDPAHVRRLIAALGDIPVILHWDLKSDDGALRQILDGHAHRITLAPRVDTRLSGWSLVDAELRALHTARTVTDAEHIAVLSGADYPLVTPEDLTARLEHWQDTSWLFNVALPYPSWNVPGFRDGGLWRFRLYFPTRQGQIIWVGSKPLFLPWHRRIPIDLEPRASSQWKIYCRDDVDRLLEVLDRRPDLVRYGRHMFTPDESFIASVLSSQRLFGSDRLQECRYGAWYLAWPKRDPRHPSWIDESDLARIAGMRGHDRPDRIDRPAAPGGRPESHRPLFARKFSSDASHIVDRIDAELRRDDERSAP